jgi:hypothetical protein
MSQEKEGREIVMALKEIHCEDAITIEMAKDREATVSISKQWSINQCFL